MTLNISCGPHIRDKWTTRFIMCTVFLSLVPVAIVGVAVHGLHAFLIILLSILSCFTTELLFDFFCHKPKTYLDGSACVTGMLLALCLSPVTPLYEPVIGGIFAILIVKCCFGGLGKNFVNPALAARCFLLMSFSKSMTVYHVDGVSAATPVAKLLSGEEVNILSMFLGTSSGVIGSSILALAMGGLLLWVFDIIRGEICFSIILTFTFFIGLFGGHGFDLHFILSNLCGGGVIMGAFFMATDYVTSPVSRLGQTLYGILIGTLGGMFRIFGTSADSFSYSIIIANLFTPLIDTYIIPKPYAFTKKAISGQNGDMAKSKISFKFFKPVFVLTIISLLAGLALGGVFHTTRDLIDKHNRESAWKAYREVIPGSETFEQVSAASPYIGKIYDEKFGKVTVNEVIAGRDGSGKILGYAIAVVSSEGYDGNIGLSVGIDVHGLINSISFTQLHETPGKGSFAADPPFKNQFSKRNATLMELATGNGLKAENTIDSISGATITSKAVVNAVNVAIELYNNVLREGTDE